MMVNHMVAELWRMDAADVMGLPMVELMECLTSVISQASSAWNQHDKSFWADTLQELAHVIYINKCTTQYMMEALESVLNANIELCMHLTTAMWERNPYKMKEDHTLPQNLVIFGGHTCNGEINLHSWRLSDCQNWELFHSLPTFIFDNASMCCQVERGIIIFQADENIRQNLLYNMDSHVWTNLPPVPTAGFRSAPMYCNGRVYILGGRGVRHKRVECLDLATRSWHTLPSMLQSDEWPLVTSVGNKLFVIFNTCPVNDKFRQNRDIVFQCYDPDTYQWSFKAPLPAAITSTRGASIVAGPNYLFLVGGPSKLCACYNTNTDRWTICSKPNLVHWFGTATFCSEKIYLLGGSSTGYVEDACSDIEVYDTHRDTWTVSERRLPVPLHSHLASTMMRVKWMGWGCGSVQHQN